MHAHARARRGALTMAALLALALSVTGLTVWPAVPAAGQPVRGQSDPEPAPTERLAGDSRIATAAAVAREAFQTAETVYLARADVFADALAAGPLTDGPTLLVPSCGPVPAVVAETVDDLDADAVIALGGTAAICDDVLDDLAGGRSSGRLAGMSRHATAVAIADHATAAGPVDVVYIGSAADSPDAIAAGTLPDGPILLADPDHVPDVTLAALDRYAPSEVVLLGGPAALSADVAGTIAAATGTVPTRLAGPGRIETAVEIARRGFGYASTLDRPAASAYLARGDVFADAIVAGALTDGPVYLVPSCGTLPADVAFDLARVEPDRVVALGGPAAVCDDILTQAGTAAAPGDVQLADHVVVDQPGIITAVSETGVATFAAGAPEPGMLVVIEPDVVDAIPEGAVLRVMAVDGDDAQLAIPALTDVVGSGLAKLEFDLIDDDGQRGADPDDGLSRHTLIDIIGVEVDLLYDIEHEGGMAIGADDFYLRAQLGAEVTINTDRPQEAVTVSLLREQLERSTRTAPLPNYPALEVYAKPTLTFSGSLDSVSGHFVASWTTGILDLVVDGDSTDPVRAIGTAANPTVDQAPDLVTGRVGAAIGIEYGIRLKGTTYVGSSSLITQVEFPSIKGSTQLSAGLVFREADQFSWEAAASLQLVPFAISATLIEKKEWGIDLSYDFGGIAPWTVYDKVFWPEVTTLPNEGPPVPLWTYEPPEDDPDGPPQLYVHDCQVDHIDAQDGQRAAIAFHPVPGTCPAADHLGGLVIYWFDPVASGRTGQMRVLHVPFALLPIDAYVAGIELAPSGTDVIVSVETTDTPEETLVWLDAETGAYSLLSQVLPAAYATFNNLMNSPWVGQDQMWVYITRPDDITSPNTSRRGILARWSYRTRSFEVTPHDAALDLDRRRPFSPVGTPDGRFVALPTSRYDIAEDSRHDFPAGERNLTVDIADNGLTAYSSSNFASAYALSVFDGLADRQLASFPVSSSHQGDRLFEISADGRTVVGHTLDGSGRRGGYVIDTADGSFAYLDAGDYGPVTAGPSMTRSGDAAVIATNSSIGGTWILTQQLREPEPELGPPPTRTVPTPPAADPSGHDSPGLVIDSSTGT